MDNGRFLFWIQPDAAYGLPVARFSRPACRVMGASSLIQSMASSKNAVVQPGMALRRCDVTDFAMAMLFVVPMHELPHPLACVGQISDCLLYTSDAADE